MLALMVLVEVPPFVPLVVPKVWAEDPHGGVKVKLGVNEKVGVPVSVTVLLGVRVAVSVGVSVMVRVGV